MTGTCRLSEPSLGDLDLSPDGGFVVTSVDVGVAEVRAVNRARALSDGSEDDTAFAGPRAVTVAFRLDNNRGDPQDMLDAVNAFQAANLRPSLIWSMPGSSQLRIVADLSPRGLPTKFDRPKYLPYTAQWVCPSGKILDPTPVVLQLSPQDASEPGRTYPETYLVDGGRGPYPFSAGVGGKLVINRGNAPADWVAVIYGPCVNPVLTVVGIPVSFTNNGGQTLVAGETIRIDTKNRTILMNGDPTMSRYAKSNFADWSWQSLRLPGGIGGRASTVRIAATSGAPTALFTTASTWR
jgi:hypothetical protein